MSIHVDDVSLVPHVDMANDLQGTTCHRSGARLVQEAGTVVSSITPGQRRSAEAMTRRAGVSADRTNVRSRRPSCPSRVLANPTGCRGEARRAQSAAAGVAGGRRYSGQGGGRSGGLRQPCRITPRRSAVCSPIARQPRLDCQPAAGFPPGLAAGAFAFNVELCWLMAGRSSALPA